MAKGQGIDETIWLFLGVVMLLAIIASFVPGTPLHSTLGALYKSLSQMFGGEPIYCPFINPYAIQIYSAGSISVSGNHPLCDAIEYAVCEVTGTGVVKSKISKCSWEPDSGKFCLCDFSGYLLNDSKCIDYGLNNKKEVVPYNHITYTVRIDEDSGKVEIELYSADMFEEGLKKPTDTIKLTTTVGKFMSALMGYQREAGGEATADLQLLWQKIPPWQCFIIYGLLPFLILYYLLNDILVFTYMRTNTRRLIALFGALAAITTGAFGNIVLSVSRFTNFATGTSFFLLILTLALISVLLGQFAISAGAGAAAANAARQAMAGMAMLIGIQNVAQRFGKQQGGNPP